MDQIRKTDEQESATNKITIKDGGGREIVCQECEGFLFEDAKVKALIPGEDLRTHVDRIKNLKIRDTDVLLCSIAKSGTHWIWEIISMLLQAKAEYDKRSKVVAMLEFRTIEEIDSLPSPRILNTHLPLSCLPREALQKRIKIVHIMRNPKDTAVSLFHHIKSMKPGLAYEGTFEEFLPLVMDKNNHKNAFWFDHVKAFEKFAKGNPDYPVLNLLFEDMKKAPTEEITRVARHLGVTYDFDLIKEIAEKCDFKNLKRADAEYKQTASGVSYIYRKGEVGDWKNWFTVAQSEEMDRIYAREMADSELKFKYSL